MKKTTVLPLPRMQKHDPEPELVKNYPKMVFPVRGRPAKFPIIVFRVILSYNAR